MDVRYTSRDLGVVDIRMAWAETHTLRPRYCEVGMGSGWDAILLIQRDLICEMAGCETSTSWPGVDLRCDMNWSWECLDMYGGDAVHGWRWDLNRGIRMQVRKVRYCGETYIFIPWCVSDGTSVELGRCSLGTWMEVRHHLDGDETRISRPFWRWDWTWIAVRCESSDLEGDNVLCGDGTRILGTWIQLRRDLSEVELYMIRPVWISNGIWMELRCNYEE